MSTWFEIVVVGSEESLRSFVAGFQAAVDHTDVLFGADLDLEPAPFHERLRDLFTSGGHHLLLAPATAGMALARALRETGAEAGLELAAVREVTEASFSFKGETFSREVAASLRPALRGSPAEGVRLEDVREDEVVDEAAKGTELYAPEHEFTYRIAARVAGALPGVLEMHRRAQQSEFVKAGPIHLTAVERKIS